MATPEISGTAEAFRNQVINASAGTGKTTTLVDLYLNGIGRGLEPGEILAITFTKKAAGEMRKRLKEEVFKRIHDRGQGADAARWRRILQELSTAPISTIHAFCGRVLRENPIVSGLDPHFVELDEEQATALRRESIAETIGDALRREEPEVQELFSQFDLERRSRYGRGGLVEAVEETMDWLGSLGVDLNLVDERGRRWVEVKLSAQEAAVRRLETEFLSMRAQALEIFRGVAAMKGKTRGAKASKWVSRVHEALPEIVRALESLTPEASPEAVRSRDFLSALCRPGALGRQDGLDVPLGVLRDLLLGREGRGSLFGHFGALKGLPLSRSFGRLVARCQEDFQGRKRQAAALDFTDLLCEARNLLKTRREVRRRYKDRFAMILVDEFQDTDRVQGEILALVAEVRAVQGTFPLLSSLEEVLSLVAFDKNRIAIVGDPKQSIYGFRQADVQVFLSMSAKIQASGGDKRDLVENYRSSREILDFVNALCRTMEADSRAAPEEGAAARPRVFFPPEEELRLPRVPLERQKQTGRILYFPADPDRRAGPGRIEEARKIASLIHELVRTGEVSGYGEVAILLRHWKQAHSFTEPFRRWEIPSYLVRGVGFYERPEVIDLCSFLAFVKDPGDDLAFATVFTSPLAGGSFADLWILSRRRQELRTSLYKALRDFVEGSPADPGARRLGPFFALCREAFRLKDRRTPAELLELALERSGYEGVMAALEGGEQRLANAGKLIESARQASRESPSMLSQFADRMRDHVRSRTRAPEAPIYGENENVVRLMTVHQAKGLEFGTVIVPSLGARSGREEARQAVFDEDLGIVCTAASGPNRALLPDTLMEKALWVAKDRRFEEEKRLLYVAATRARRILVLSEGFTSGRGPWLKWVRQAVGWEPPKASDATGEAPPSSVFRCPGVEVELGEPLCAPSPPGADDGPAPEPPGADEIEAAAGRVFRWQAPRPLLVELTPSALEDLALCSRYYFLAHKAGLREPSGFAAFSPTGLLEGEIVHRLLRRVDQSLSTEDAQLRQRELSRLLDLDESVPLLPQQRRREMIAHLSRYLEGPTWKTLQGNPSLRRELAFQLCLKGEGVTLLVSGRMDALAPDPAGPLVIETKYSRFEAQRAEHYRLSALIYALAALRSARSPRAVTRLIFLKSDPATAVDFVLDSPDQVQRELLKLAAGYVRRGQTHEPEDWPRIARTQCDRHRCGFRRYCWGSGEA